MTTAPSSEIVSLAPGPNGGLDVPVDAYKLAFELLGRDLILSQEGDKLKIKSASGGKPELSEDEVARIKKWKVHMMALLAYRAPEIA